MRNGDSVYSNSSIRSLPKEERRIWNKAEHSAFINMIETGRYSSPITGYRPRRDSASVSGVDFILRIVTDIYMTSHLIEAAILPTLWLELSDAPDVLLQAVYRLKEHIIAYTQLGISMRLLAHFIDEYNARRRCEYEHMRSEIVSWGERIFTAHRNRTAAARNLIVEGQYEQALAVLTEVRLMAAEAVEELERAVLLPFEPTHSFITAPTETPLPGSGLPENPNEITAQENSGKLQASLGSDNGSSLGSSSERDASACSALLTAREMDVVYMIVAGKSNNQIAEELSLAQVTVKGYLRSILNKLGLENRTQIAVYALRNGWAV
jgi:DNA-binding CsgD family transcriptional regulator